MKPYELSPEEYAAFYEENFSDLKKFPRIGELISNRIQPQVTHPIYKEEKSQAIT